MSRIVQAWFVLTPAGAAGPWYIQAAARGIAAEHGWHLERREVELFDDGTYRTLAGKAGR